MASPLTLPSSAHRRRRVSIISWLAALSSARRQRRTLADLDDAMLRDIGLTRGQALEESRRPLWDVPQTWRK